ncbi:MAG: DUF1214 domain-containing protein [Phyllobacteriaceae bacterium]|nr:DUF1214 domain-containing protein [Phyllobacteriaceae bacterium]
MAAGRFPQPAIIGNWPAIGGLSQGPWVSLPSLGSPDANPYALAYQQSDLRLALGGAEGNVHVASTDSAGERLDPACTYRVAGTPLLAQVFTLRAETADGVALAPPAPLPALVSSSAMVFSASGYSVTVSARAAPGNWLALGGDAPFVLVLTLYDVAVGNDNVGSGIVLPAITRESCADA